MAPHVHDPLSSAPVRGIAGVDHLAEHLREALPRGAWILGVGNDLCGDDGVGPRIVRHIAGGPWTALDTQSVPESFLMKIVRSEPPSLLLIDALHFGAAPGTVELFEPESLCGQGPSTHGPAPLAFLDLLAMMHPCPPRVLGIQPATADFGEPMTAPVRRAAADVLRAFRLLARPGEG